MYTAHISIYEILSMSTQDSCHGPRGLIAGASLDDDNGASSKRATFLPPESYLGGCRYNVLLL